ncbi:MAG: CPBP family intramembrane metalloprotease [Bacteroidaceae bacterium]|nr:CPBP family intramembrane metalloprotease [Bacteroidaceae bacterium]
MKKILYPVLVVIVFLVMQVLGGVGMIIIAIFKNPSIIESLRNRVDPNTLINQVMASDALAWALILSGLGSALILTALRMIEWKTVLNVKMIDWKIGMIGIVGALLGIFYTDCFSEFFELRDDMGDIFNSMSNTLVGALAIGVTGPIIEEFIFREALLGFMLRNNWNKWVAISVSAVVFGLIHANPAQIPFAVVVGFIFGLIYYKTGNIVIPSILHIINNSSAVWMMYSMGDEAKDASLQEWLGGRGITIGVIIPLGVVCFWLLRLFWIKYPQNEVTNQLNAQDNETVL